MSGLAAFDTALMSGIRQIETAVLVCPTGAITGNGDARVIVTADGMTGSPITEDVALLAGDTTIEAAEKIRTALGLVANIVAYFDVGGAGVNIRLERLAPAADDATMNISIENLTCTDITDDTTSNDTLAGAALAEVASVTNISGPPLSADVEDATAHDSPDAFEEVVATIKRTGEMKLEINYDPGDATHDATTGLIYKYENQIFADYEIRFPDVGKTQFDFRAYITSFEPGTPHEGKLSASVGMKISGIPDLADVWV